MPCRQRLSVVSSQCTGCAALIHEYAALQRRVSSFQRQLRATANLHQLLAAKDREVAFWRARLERLEERKSNRELSRKTDLPEDDVEVDGEATVITSSHDDQLEPDGSGTMARDLRLLPPNDNLTPTSTDGEQQSLHRNSVNSGLTPPPPRDLVAKLVDQNSRLKSMLRQMIVDQGLTVQQFLEGQERRDVALQLGV